MTRRVGQVVVSTRPNRMDRGGRNLAAAAVAAFLRILFVCAFHILVSFFSAMASLSRSDWATKMLSSPKARRALLQSSSYVRHVLRSYPWRARSSRESSGARRREQLVDRQGTLFSSWKGRGHKAWKTCRLALSSFRSHESKELTTNYFKYCKRFRCVGGGGIRSLVR